MAKSRKNHFAQTPADAKIKDFLDMVSPSVIQFNVDHYLCGNTYRCVWALREYPTATDEQAILRHLGEKDGITLRIYTRQVTPAEEKRIIHNAANKHRMSRSSTDDLQQTVTAESNLQDVVTLVSAMHRNREPLLHCAVYLELTAQSYDQLKLLQTEVLTELVRSKLNVDRLMLRQQQGFVSVMPSGHNAFGSQFERVLPASSVANLYPFNYSGKTDPQGFYIGKDKYGANVIVDFDKRDDDKTSANILILGNSGQGKSYLMKLLLLNLLEAGKSAISLDVEHEQKDMCEAVGGCFLDLMSGQYRINPLEPKCWDAGGSPEDMDAPAAFRQSTRLSQHISFLRDFFRSYKSFTDRQIDVIEIMVGRLYERWRISDSTDFSRLTPLDESGANLDYRAIDSFYEHNRVEGLAEMMNYVGVANADEQVLEKIVAAQAHHKKIDGHAPGLSGNDLNAYVAAGVYSDHECSDMGDALAKLERGQYIMIREGTAARNLDALLPLLTPQYYTYCMFCTDDKHPNDLLEKGHIDYIIKKAIAAGVDPIIAVKCASHHAARYFLLNNRGAIAPGFLADFVIIDNFRDFNILEVYKKGKLMFDGKEVAPFEAPEIDPHLIKRSHETFHVAHLTADDFTETRPRAVLGMVPGEIVTTDAGYADKIDLENDILKIAVIERHKNTHHIGIGYIKGYGLKSGAVATSISHDSHNIIVVGTNEEDIAAAANRVVELGGGIVVLDHGEVLGEVRLQIAGIMSEEPLVDVNRELENAKEKAFALGVSRGVDPFMTLSFMALPVIPTLRLTTRGVFDTVTQKYV